MKVGDLVIARVDYGNVKKDEICKIKSFKKELVFVEYQNVHWYVFQYLEPETLNNLSLYTYFQDIFYTIKEMRKMKLLKMKNKKKIYKLKTRVIRKL
jgi:hypothetical protein